MFYWANKMLLSKKDKDNSSRDSLAAIDYGEK